MMNLGETLLDYSKQIEEPSLTVVECCVAEVERLTAALRVATEDLVEALRGVSS